MQYTQNKISAHLKRHAFKAGICPFVERLYRTALIITGSPRAATKLLQKIYRKAWAHYKTADHVADFAGWLAAFVSQNFLPAREAAR